MGRKTEIFEAKLCSETIDAVSDRIHSFLSEYKLSKRDIIRYAISAEEILLRNMENGGEGQDIKLILNSGFKKQIILEINGKNLNVYADEENDRGKYGGGMLKNLGLAPEYRYSWNNNRYLFRIKKNGSNYFSSLIIALCAAIIIGLSGRLLDASVKSILLDFVLTPLNDLFLNILKCIAGPMIFLSVAWGIYGMGDAATLKRIGKKLIISYTGVIFIAVLFCGCAIIPFLSLKFGKVGGGSAFSAMTEMIFGIVPKDIFSPFLDGNTLQIIFIAILVGTAMLFLGEKTENVASFVEQINYIVQFLIEAISRLVPYFIFVVIVKMLWGNTFAALAGIGNIFIMYICAVIIYTFAIILILSLKNRMNPFILMKKGFPSFIIAITTASSAATFGTNMKACNTEFGIDEKMSSFGIPLGMVMFKPTTAMAYFAMSLYFAGYYELKISFLWIAIAMITVTILAIATPPIVGGALASYTVLFLQLGIPAEALAIALACDAVFDFISTGFDQYLMPYILMSQASRLGMVDRNILCGKKEKDK